MGSRREWNDCNCQPGKRYPCARSEVLPIFPVAQPAGPYRAVEHRDFHETVIGEHSRAGDLVVNVNKSKKLTNMRASGSDDKVLIPPPVTFSLEEYMEIIRNDEYLEVTPRSLRLRKILLNEHERKRMSKNP